MITAIAIMLVSVACVLNSISIRNLAKTSRANGQALDTALEALRGALRREARRSRADG